MGGHAAQPVGVPMMDIRDIHPEDIHILRTYSDNRRLHYLVVYDWTQNGTAEITLKVHEGEALYKKLVPILDLMEIDPTGENKRGWYYMGKDEYEAIVGG